MAQQWDQSQQNWNQQNWNQQNFGQNYDQNQCGPQRTNNYNQTKNNGPYSS